MPRLGEQAPHFQGPALLRGAMTYIESAQYRGRWTVLCFVPHLGLLEAMFLDRQAQTFAREGTALLTVSPDGDVVRQPWSSRGDTLKVPILADPLRRLRRSYRIAPEKQSRKCYSFLIDPEGVLRFHLIHDLNGRGMGALLEIVGACRSQEASVV